MAEVVEVASLFGHQETVVLKGITVTVMGMSAQSIRSLLEVSASLEASLGMERSVRPHWQWPIPVGPTMTRRLQQPTSTMRAPLNTLELRRPLQ